jgi:uncharacterized phage protein gp47/JayE
VIECLIEGENETSDADVRTAYFDYVNSVATDGNVNQYYRWCDEYDGIGNAKVMPLWNGANTVKVSILNASNRKASDILVAEFQEYLDPNSKGMGDGVAPIGAFVTVTTATEVPLSISGDVTLEDGYDDTSILNEGLVKYFKEIAYKKDILSYMQIGSAILDIDGVGFITNLKINGSTNDITLTDDQIPTLGETNWSVV